MQGCFVVKRHERRKKLLVSVCVTCDTTAQAEAGWRCIIHGFCTPSGRGGGGYCKVDYFVVKRYERRKKKLTSVSEL